MATVKMKDLRTVTVKMINIKGRFHGIGDQFVVWSEGEEELGMTWDSGLGDWVESGTTN